MTVTVFGGYVTVFFLLTTHFCPFQTLPAGQVMHFPLCSMLPASHSSITVVLTFELDESVFPVPAVVAAGTVVDVVVVAPVSFPVYVLLGALASTASVELPLKKKLYRSPRMPRSARRPIKAQSHVGHHEQQPLLFGMTDF